MASVICVHFSQLVDHCVTYASHNTIDHTRAKMLISAVERQVSWSGINDEVVGH